jgi:hypothetical protein
MLNNVLHSYWFRTSPEISTRHHSEQNRSQHHDHDPQVQHLPCQSGPRLPPLGVEQNKAVATTPVEESLKLGNDGTFMTASYRYGELAPK